MQQTSNHSQDKEEITVKIPKILRRKKPCQDFPGGPVVKTLRFHYKGTGLIPGGGTKMPHGAAKKTKQNKAMSFSANGEQLRKPQT